MLENRGQVRAAANRRSSTLLSIHHPVEPSDQPQAVAHLANREKCAITLDGLRVSRNDGANSGPPTVLHFCAAHCATWYLTTDRRGYSGLQGQASPEPYGVKIVTFNDQMVVLDRTDPPNQWFPQGLKATITGAVAYQ
jgi:hypothetical protein